MGTYITNSGRPKELLRSFWGNRQLIFQLCKRDILSRYKGSFIGIFWSFLIPLIMLAVYTFVFSVVLKIRWGGVANENRLQFALILFVGLIVHGLFAEVINRAPSLITSNVNYVKKVVFPLEILPIVSINTTLFHSAVSLLIMLIAFFCIYGYLNWTIVLLPLTLLPLIVLTLGIAWFVASLGVFIRDIGQSMGIITTLLLFTSPVFFPISALPESYRIIVMVNPLSFIIEQAREVLIWGHPPNWIGLVYYSLVASVIAIMGFMWFQKTRRGFADVL